MPFALIGLVVNAIPMVLVWLIGRLRVADAMMATLKPLGAVLVFIVVFSALASSLDSLLAATADLILQDIYRGHLRPAAGDNELRVAAKLIILGLGLGAWLLCLPRLTTLAELLYFTGAFVSSTIWPMCSPVCLSMGADPTRYSVSSGTGPGTGRMGQSGEVNLSLLTG